MKTLLPACGLRNIRLFQSFRALHGLSQDDVYDVLTDVARGDMTMDGAAAAVMKKKQMEFLQKSFVAKTKSADWDDARERFPNHASEEAFLPFLKKGKQLR